MINNRTVDTPDAFEKRIRTLLAQKPEHAPVLVAIDGGSCAGKSTYAKALAAQFDCNVFHMDDFFLRPEQRTEERFVTPGGNVDYERFQEDVLTPLLAGGDFSYRPFDCHRIELGEPIPIKHKRLNIIEGTYSLHPLLRSAYDTFLFMEIGEELQRARILKRSPHLQDKFFTFWLPMERQYFAEFHCLTPTFVVS